MAIEQKEITVQGMSMPVMQPYAAGHQVSEAEAKALNQVRAENVANNLRKHFKQMIEDAGGESTPEVEKAARKMFAEYDKQYEFTLATASGASTLSPLEKECRRLARGLISDKLREAGVTQKAYLEKNGEDALKIKIAELAEHPKIVETAKANLEERAKLAEVKL